MTPMPGAAINLMPEAERRESRSGRREDRIVSAERSGFGRKRWEEKDRIVAGWSSSS